ncbi:MAG: acylphosphatase [Planctomycetota bacterium]|jgi:acylphosphatase
MNRKRIRAFFSGMVQGVGFRWTTRSIASNYKIRGFVKNLADGRVELLAEGESGEISAFMENLKSKMSRYISDIETQNEQPGEMKDGFDIEF